MFFDGFGEAESLDVDGEPVRLRRAGAGPAVLLLHGHPQTHAMWHAVAPVLSRRWTVIAPDLPGYGGSRPRAGSNALPGTADAMARRMVALLDRLGVEEMRVVGHDRGGRVAHRIALGWPERTSRLALLDVVPVPVPAERDDMAFALATYRAFWFAQRHPKPEASIHDGPERWLAGTLPGEGPAAPFHPAAVADYLAGLADAEAAAELNEAYRTALEQDAAADRTSRSSQARVACPTLVLWGRERIGGWYDPVELWRECVSGPVSGSELPAGHFLAEEQPDLVASALMAFLS